MRILQILETALQLVKLVLELLPYIPIPPMG